MAAQEPRGSAHEGLHDRPPAAAARRPRAWAPSARSRVVSRRTDPGPTESWIARAISLTCSENRAERRQGAPRRSPRPSRRCRGRSPCGWPPGSDSRTSAGGPAAGCASRPGTGGRPGGISRRDRTGGSGVEPGPATRNPSSRRPSARRRRRRPSASGRGRTIEQVRRATTPEANRRTATEKSGASAGPSRSPGTLSGTWQEAIDETDVAGPKKAANQER